MSDDGKESEFRLVSREGSEAHKVGSFCKLSYFDHLLMTLT